MDSFDKKMKDSLSHYDEKIPDGMSWDEMVGGIESKMPTKKRRFVPVIFWFGIGLLLTGTIAAGYRYNQKSSQQVVEYGSTNYTKEKQSLEKIDVDIIAPTETVIEKDITAADGTGIEVQVSSNIESQLKRANGNIVKMSPIVSINETNVSTISNANQETQSKDLVEKMTELKQEIANPNNETKNSVYRGPNKEIGDLVENEKAPSSVDKQSSQDLGGLFAQSLELSFFDWTTRPEALQYKEFPIIPARKDDKVPPLVLSYYIALDGGVTLWDWNQEANDQFNIANFEREQISYNSHLTFGANLSKSFALESGLSFYSLESEFNHKFVNTSETLGEHEIYNVITREYESLIGIVEVKNTRTIRHFNSIKQFSIPLIAIYRLKYRKFGAGFGLGPELRIANIASGRTINKMGEFVDYTENSTLSQAIGLGAVARVELMYNLYDKLSIYSAIRYKGSITDWTTSSEIARNPNLFSIGLGVRKTF